MKKKRLDKGALTIVNRIIAQIGEKEPALKSWGFDMDAWLKEVMETIERDEPLVHLMITKVATVNKYEALIDSVVRRTRKGAIAEQHTMDVMSKRLHEGNEIVRLKTEEGIWLTKQRNQCTMREVGQLARQYRRMGNKYHAKADWYDAIVFQMTLVGLTDQDTVADFLKVI